MLKGMRHTPNQLVTNILRKKSLDYDADELTPF